MKKEKGSQKEENAFGARKKIKKKQSSKSISGSPVDTAGDKNEVQFKSPQEQASWFHSTFCAVYHSVLSPLEVGSVSDETMVEVSGDHGLKNFSENVKSMIGPSWQTSLCNASTETDIEAGNPVILIICSSAIRCVNILKSLRSFTKECKPGKLFAKHLKVDEQVAALKIRVNIAAGTPNRVKKLIDIGALGLSRLSVIILDMQKDAKGLTLFAVPEVKKEFWELYRIHLHSQVCRFTRIRCEQSEPSVSRRHALIQLSSGAWAIGSWNGVSLNDHALAADLIQRSQRTEFQGKIKTKLAYAIKENQELVPYLLRLALNDSLTYEKETKTGGPNGSIHLSEELNRPENQMLSSAVTFLEGLKKDLDAESKGGPITWADLVQIGGQAAAKRTFLDAAARKCGGNEDKGNFLYTAYGSNGQWGFFDKQFGRTDTQQPDPEGRVLAWEEATVPDIKKRFSKVGLGPRQIAVLSAFLGTDQQAMETKLAEDPEFAPWVTKYKRSRDTVSQTDYEVDLIGAFTKLSILGQSINYEAYTYPPKKGKFKF